MKFRVAKKVRGNIGTPREQCYKQSTLRTAIKVYWRTREARGVDRYWHSLMHYLGVEGRAQIVARHNPGGALRMLMASQDT